LIYRENQLLIPTIESNQKAIPLGHMAQSGSEMLAFCDLTRLESFTASDNTKCAASSSFRVERHVMVNENISEIDGNDGAQGRKLQKLHF